jgi:hypothetical protein
MGLMVSCSDTQQDADDGAEYQEGVGFLTSNPVTCYSGHKSVFAAWCSPSTGCMNIKRQGSKGTGAQKVALAVVVRVLKLPKIAGYGVLRRNI